MPELRRRVRRSDSAGTGRQPISSKDEDSPLTAILTWIPAEVIIAYKAIMGVVPMDALSTRLWLSILFVPLCALWIGYATKPANAGIAWRQLIIAPIAFIFWVAAIQEDVVRQLFSGWQPWIGSVTLVLGTLILPIIEGILKALGVPQAK